MVAESDFPNGHAVLEPVGSGRLPREKMVYMAVKDTSQGEDDISEFWFSFLFAYMCLQQVSSVCMWFLCRLF